jgi:DNA-binding MarR family transcriptional regulator
VKKRARAASDECDHSSEVAAIDAARTISQECLAIRARRLQRGITRIYDGALRAHGLSVAQLGILVVVALKGQVQPKVLCQILDLEKSTLSRNVALMVTKGWVEAEAAGRSQILRLTQSGAALLARARPAWEGAQREALARLPPGTVNTLRHARSMS